MSLFIVWLGVMFPLVFSPGPANIVFAASGARVGLKRSIPLVAGIDTVFIIKSLIVGYGLGEVIERYPNIISTLQVLGALYLIYLAVKFIKSSSNKEEGGYKPLGFVDGALIQMLNSKGWIMLFLMFSLFTEQAQQSFGNQGVLVLVVWLAILNITLHLVWVKLGDLLARISNHKGYETALNIFYASCLLVMSGWLLLEDQLVI